MKMTTVFGMVVILGWVWLSILISDKFFQADRIAEIVILVCCASVGVFLSFSTEYFVGKVKDQRKNSDGKIG